MTDHKSLTFGIDCKLNGEMFTLAFEYRPDGQVEVLVPNSAWSRVLVNVKDLARAVAVLQAYAE